MNDMSAVQTNGQLSRHLSRHQDLTRHYLNASPAPKAGPPRPDMVWVPGGSFMMGSDQHYPEEGPAHKVRVEGFWMQAGTVSNRDYARFVAETAYRTMAERVPDAALYPGALPEMLVPGSMVFIRPRQRVDLLQIANWWAWMPGADWRHPLGPDSNLEGKEDHPVVQLALEDVQAYVDWAGLALPTEAEWEFAARGGLDGASYVWGDDFMPEGQAMANTWRGEFPWQYLGPGKHHGTMPAHAFPPNGYGLHQMAGNVWEWTADWYRQRHEAPAKPCCVPLNPRGGNLDGSYDAQHPQFRIARRVIKGGSHLCAPNYCRRYRPAARAAHPVDTGACHIGFRCIARPETAKRLQ
jgi:sulfatase modifying factor 1